MPPFCAFSVPLLMIFWRKMFALLPFAVIVPPLALVMVSPE